MTGVFKALNEQLSFQKFPKTSPAIKRASYVASQQARKSLQPGADKKRNGNYSRKSYK